MKSVITSILISILFGCQQNITLELPKYEPKVAVYSILEPGSVPVVLLSLSQSYYSYGDTTPGYIPIKNAVVTITDQTANTTDALSLDSGIYFNSWYYYSHRPSIVGHHYILNINYLGSLINAATTIPMPVIIKSFTHERIDDPNSGLTHYIFHLFFQDIVGEQNFYTSPPPNGFVVNNFYTNFTSDYGLDGKQLETTTDTYIMTSSLIDSVGYQVTVKTVTPEMEKYDTDIWTQIHNGPLSQPVIIESNVNGGLGVFGALSTSPLFNITVK